MKFTQLTIGAEFTFQGKRYVKVGPLTARNLDDNRQRMIPRSALVECEGTTPTPPPAPQRLIPTAEVEALLNAFAREAVAAVKELQPEADDSLLTRLEAIHQQLQQRLHNPQ